MSVGDELRRSDDRVEIYPRTDGEWAPSVTVITPVGPNWNAGHLAAARDSLASNRISIEWILSCDRADPAAVFAIAGDAGIPVAVIGGLEDVGIAAARNAAITIARGEWIYAFDADDICLSGIDTLMRTALGTGTDWAAGTAHDVDSSGAEIIYVPETSLAPFDDLIPKGAFLGAFKQNGQYPFLCSGATLIRTHIVRALGGWSEPLRDSGEDIALLTAVSRNHVGSWAGVEPVMLYRKHAASITAGRRDSALENSKLAYTRKTA